MPGKREKQNRNEQLKRNRGHRLGRHVKPTPAMLKRAGERALLYMHSFARRRSLLPLAKDVGRG